MTCTRPHVLLLLLLTAFVLAPDARAQRPSTEVNARGATLGVARTDAPAGRFGQALARADGSVTPGSYQVPDHGPLTYYRNGGVTLSHSASQEIVLSISPRRSRRWFSMPLNSS